MRSLATCGEHDKLVPYLRVQYCAFGGGKSLTNAFRVAVAFACVAVLSTSSRRFLLPALENLARACRLPDDAAGVTLLALANAAPWLVAKALRVAERCARDGCVGGFADDPRRGEGLRSAADEALRGAAILVALVFPICVLATPHGMGGRVRRNEDDERDTASDARGVSRDVGETADSEAEGLGPNANPFARGASSRARAEYTPVLSASEEANGPTQTSAGDDHEHASETEAGTERDTEAGTRRASKRTSSPRRGGSGSVGDPDELSAPLLPEDRIRDDDDDDDDARFRYATAPGRELARLTGASRSRTLRAFWKRHVEAAFAKGGVELERAPFARDATVFLAAAIVSVSVAGNGALSRAEAWTLVGLSVAYVVAVALPGLVAAARERPLPRRADLPSNAPERRVGAPFETDGEPFDDAYAALLGDAGSAGSLGLVIDLPGAPALEEASENGRSRRLGPRNGAPGMRWGGGRRIGVLRPGRAGNARIANPPERGRDVRA